MDKTEFEQYEYLPNDELDSSQLLVVQEDGTFLCFNSPIQYVTQVEDVKNALEGVQGCDKYDVTSQQHYVDGESSSELISVSDQFILPDGQSNEYENNYLLEVEENAKEEPMEEDDVQYKEITESVETIDNHTTDMQTIEGKNSGDCTEITLNDEQYQLLEQKGWILLKSGDKTFLLDSSGLHDITADEKLIVKLKCELQEENDEVSSSMKKEHRNIKDEENPGETQLTENMIHYVIENEGIIQDHESQANMNYTTNKQKTLHSIIEDTIGETSEADIAPIEAEHDYVKLSSVKNSFAKKQNDALKLKTKFSFKDIPSEIVLGKFNGKKLVARVTKTERPKKLGSNIQRAGNIGDQSGFLGLEDRKFDKLIGEAVRGTIECGVTNVTAAEIVVVQLSRVAAFRPALLERGLIITKVIVQELDSGELYSEGTPSLVTGRAMRDTLNNCRFRFMPNMLWRLANEFQYEVRNENSKYDFLHIHIRETKGTDGIIRISITLNKRNIPLHLFKDNIKHPKAIFACSSCGRVYNSEKSLQVHEETECMVLENSTIDSEEAKNEFTIISTDRGNHYACNQCNVVYTKLANCQAHIETHANEDNMSAHRKAQMQIRYAAENKKPLGLYRCKMCNRAYLDAATLSKHIVTRHIKNKN